MAGASVLQPMETARIKKSVSFKADAPLAFVGVTHIVESLDAQQIQIFVEVKYLYEHLSKYGLGANRKLYDWVSDQFAACSQLDGSDCYKSDRSKATLDQHVAEVHLFFRILIHCATRSKKPSVKEEAAHCLITLATHSLPCGRGSSRESVEFANGATLTVFNTGMIEGFNHIVGLCPGR